MKRFTALMLVFALVSGGFASAATPQANLPEIEDEVMCPICGTLLGLSRAPAAERQRVFIRGLIQQGLTKEEIKDELVAEYGPQVLALPDDEGINAWAYIVPVLIFVVGGLGVLLAVIQWRRNRSSEPPPGDGPPGGSSGGGQGGLPEQEGRDAARLDRDMAKYDL